MNKHQAFHQRCNPITSKQYDISRIVSHQQDATYVFHTAPSPYPKEQPHEIILKAAQCAANKGASRNKRAQRPQTATLIGSANQTRATLSKYDVTLKATKSEKGELITAKPAGKVQHLAGEVTHTDFSCMNNVQKQNAALQTPKKNTFTEIVKKR